MTYQHAKRLFDEAMTYRNTDPERAIRMLQEGRTIAESLQDPCFVISFDDYIGNILLHHCGDYDRAIDYLMKSLLEARKPKYDKCEERGSIYMFVSNAFMIYDPVGYEAQVREALDLVDHAMRLDQDAWCLVKGMQGYLEFALRRFEQALALGMAYLNRCETYRGTFRLSHAHIFLCRVYLELGDDEKAQQHAELSEYYALRALETERYLMEAWAIQAYFARRQGDEPKAQRFYARCLQQWTRIQSKLTFAIYESLYRFHEQGGQYAQALKLSEQHIAQEQIGTTPFLLSEVYLRRITLLKAASLPYDDEYQQAYTIAAKFQQPEQFRVRLAQVVAS
ncbi:MAG: hypothetical protein MUF87_10195 [Anaerolineae bacterium]|nr:hypothetical protein [Anaerolineae bacterium]